MNFRDVAFLIILLVTSTLTFGQSSKWSIGLLGSPNYTLINSDEFLYKANLSYSFGVESSYRISGKSRINLELYYTNINYEVKYYFIYVGTPDPAIPRSGVVSANYIDIPVLYDFLFVKEKLQVYSSIGLVPAFLISSDDKTTFEDNSIRDSGYLSSFLLSSQLGVGLGYKINEKIEIKFEPQFRKYLSSIDSFMGSNTIAIKGLLGVVYRIKSIEE